MNRASFFAWRPRTTIILLGGFALVLVALVIAYVSANFRPTTQVWVNAAMYTVRVADTETARQQGLSGVKKLHINEGLLMQYDTPSECGIWMKDMVIPLDIIWMDKDKKIIHIKENVNPELGTSEIMRPPTPCRYVLELPSGSVKNSAIKLSHQAQFTLEGESE